MSRSADYSRDRRVRLVGYKLTTSRERLTAEVQLKWGETLSGKSEGFDPNELLARASLEALEDLCVGKVALHLAGCWAHEAQEPNRVVIVRIRLREQEASKKPEYIYGVGASDAEPFEPAPVKAVLNALNRRIAPLLPPEKDVTS